MSSPGSAWLCRLLAACCVVLSGVCLQPADAQQRATHLVATERGQLPIILSAPHGGRLAISGVAKRAGKGVASFRTVQDVNTGRLVEQVADAIEAELGKRPYTVVAQFHRRYVDANRPLKDACESKAAEVYYDTFHRALHEARADVIQHWGRGLLLDIHGQAAEPRAIVRGTQNGRTVTHLVQRFGGEALTGETSLFGRLASQGFSVIPEVGADAGEDRRYSGGFIVQTYGSSAGSTLDAIQLELGRELRSAEEISTTAGKLATAIIQFAGEYLPETPIGDVSTEQPPTEQPSVGQPPTEQPSSGLPPSGLLQVGVYHDVGAGASVDDLLSVLGRFPEIAVLELKADDIRSGALAGVDVLIHPGGSGGRQGRHLGDGGRQSIRKFISDGGGFIGICAGAYLASADYSWSLNVLDARVLDRKHWARGTGTVELGLTDNGQRILNTKSDQLQIFYGQGPLLAPHDNPDIPDYETIATYRTEIAKNGAPKGVMPGTTAIAHGRFGQGRVLCFSPHPEKTQGLEELVREAIEHVKRRRPSVVR